MIAPTDTILGANAERSRSHNRQMVLGHVRAAGQIGRAEIARASGLSIQAVSNITSDLLDEGLIQQQGRKATGRGQPPVLYSLNPDGGFALGVEVRTDAVFAAVLNLTGRMLASDRRPLKATDRETVTETVLALCDAVRRRARVAAKRVLGAGIVMPGPFGATGIRDSGSDLPGWDDISPADWFAARLKLPVVIENDANAAAIAARISGGSAGLETYAFLYFGQGLGLGAVHNGRLVTGAFGNAGEIGHIPVPQAGRAVALETAVSRLSVQRALEAAGFDVRSGADLAALYAAREPALMAWLDAAREPLSSAITIIENLLDPQTVILGGAMPDAILEHLVASVALSPRSVASRTDRRHPRLIKGASGRMTATMGAAALVINQAITPKLAVQT